MATKIGGELELVSEILFEMDTKGWGRPIDPSEEMRQMHLTWEEAEAALVLGGSAKASEG